MDRDQLQAFAELSQTIIERLECLERAGVTHLPKSRGGATLSASSAAATGDRPTTGESPASSAVWPTPSPESRVPSPLPSALFDATEQRPTVSAAERPVLLDIIRTEVAGCTRCAELAAGRTQTVFGVGNPSARLMFVGEAPGADEDRQGEPFVGRAGQLLNNIVKACRLNREDVYIANVIKCRPPGNRNPLPDEVLNCIGFLHRQIAIVQPEFICCLGAVAAKALLKTESPIGRLRGKFHLYEGIPVVCTYHPAYLLRNPAAKHDTWADMKMLFKRMGVDL
jgi:uracil-DNA glycosylase family 4